MAPTKKISQTQDSVLEPDEFSAPEFESKSNSLPYLQILNDKNLDSSGFFITSENLEAVNFSPNDDWSLYSTTFQSGGTVEGYRSLTARFLILRKSDLLTFDRDSGEFLSAYNKTRYNRDSMVLKVRYLVYLVNQKKQLLHDRPLIFTSKGSVCGSFGDAVKGFRQDMNRAYRTATGATKDRGDRFFALAVFAVRLKPELKGDKKKSWVCTVENYGSPTAENWQSFFVGYDPALKERLLKEFDEWENFATLSQGQYIPTPEHSDYPQAVDESDF